MHVDFSQIDGPHGSREDNFQELIGQLLYREQSAETIDGSGGDQGIDCFFRSVSGKVTVFQVKYFLTHLKSGQWRKIEASFEAAWKHHKPERWILCTPVNPTIQQRQRFDEFVHGRAESEWWGETAIRSLLEKHSDIQQAFFPEQVTAGEFRAFRQEVAGLERAISLSRWRVGKESTPLEYLSRVVRLSDTLLTDATLLDSSQSDAIVAIDFSELHTFMESDPSLAIATPIVDYCIDQTPRPLTLPPGTVQELRAFVSALLRHGQHRLQKSSLSRQDKKRLLESFVRAYDEAPNSALAWERFRELLRSSVSKGGVANFQLQKLLRVLDNSLTPPPHQAKLLSMKPSSPLREILDIFHRLRPGNGKGNLADAANMLFLVTTFNESHGQARLISSARSFGQVGEQVFKGRSPVRTAWEYAYLINLSHTSWSTEESLAKFSMAAKSLLLLVGKEGFTSSSAPPVLERQAVFRQFAPFYRDLLRPVDRMVESGPLALPRTLAMSELYLALKSESDLVSGFRRWWEEISITLHELDAVLASRYYSGDIAAAFEEFEKNWH